MTTGRSRRALAVVLAAVVTIGAAACDQAETGPERPPRQQALVEESAEIVRLIDAGDYAAVEERFDDGLRDNLDADALADVWRSFESAVGPFEEIAGDAATGFSEGVDIVDTPVRFRDDVLKVRTTFDDGALAGFFVLLLSAPLPQESPSPAD